MNWQTWVVLGVIAVIFLAVVITGIINKKKGKHSCSCGCSGCAMKDACHKAK
ncbi:MAG: FeoB-associated Cys-rich membrane protein [Clostridia bacterium]|nr:FeoB-associated Cys-rich membrane protein [Clostridia bacterium]